MCQCPYQVCRIVRRLAAPLREIGHEELQKKLAVSRDTRRCPCGEGTFREPVDERCDNGASIGRGRTLRLDFISHFFSA